MSIHKFGVFAIEIAVTMYYQTDLQSVYFNVSHAKLFVSVEKQFVSNGKQNVSARLIMLKSILPALQGQ